MFNFAGYGAYAVAVIVVICVVTFAVVIWTYKKKMTKYKMGETFFQHEIMINALFIIFSVLFLLYMPATNLKSDIHTKLTLYYFL